MDAVIEQAASYGLEGLVIAALFMAILALIREQRNILFDHSQERDKWLEYITEQSEVLREISEKIRCKTGL